MARKKTGVTRLKRVEIGDLQYYPFFIDYDFVEARPRGGSAFIDFFACGKLCKLMDKVDADGLVYVEKNGIAPESGFFLMDFARVVNEAEAFVRAVLDLKLDYLYIEDSRRYPLDGVLVGLEKVGICLVSFIP